jgi:DNA-directed RNA polymerase subunit RPC12/RpoP
MTNKLKTAVGSVSYEVKIQCPNCGNGLNLNQAPYTDDCGDYGHAEDLLGLEVFGMEKEPARWMHFEIEYKCIHCKEFFVINGLET